MFIWGLILSISCQSDSILLDPPNGYIYEQLQLQLDTVNSFSLQQDSHTGYSPRLYSGVVNIDDTVTMLINLTPSALESEDICKSTTIVNDLYLELTLVSPLQGIDSLTIDYSSTNNEAALEIKSYIFNYLSNDHIVENKVLTINSVIWSDQYLGNSFNPYYIDNVSSNYWGTIYVLDISDYQWNNMPISFDSLSIGVLSFAYLLFLIFILPLLENS